jgi:uncharacterized protein (TIGR03435 family)
MQDKLLLRVRGLTVSLLSARRNVFSGRKLYVSSILLALSGACIFSTPVQPQQSSGSKPQFEVVSIRPNISGQSGNRGLQLDGYRGVDVPMPELILGAYGLKFQYQLIGLPKWAQSAHYDITAKVGDSDVPILKTMGSRERYKMFQTVLEDRFSLRCHWEKRTLPAHTLQVSGNKANMKKLQSVDPAKIVTTRGASVGAGTFMMTADQKFIAQAITIRQLVSFLEEEMHMPVADGTGLTGEYDFEMQLPSAREQSSISGSDDNGLSHPPDPIDTGDWMEDGLSQIGLKLVPSKSELPVLVIDELKPPSPN